LKLVCEVSDPVPVLSPPVRGAWIETRLSALISKRSSGSPPVRGAWIETSLHWYRRVDDVSPPVRGAWIETPIRENQPNMSPVASREGGVD
jgi:hypothetical protein